MSFLWSNVATQNTANLDPIMPPKNWKKILSEIEKNPYFFNPSLVYSRWSSSLMTPAAPPADWMEPVTPTPSASLWVAHPPAPAPHHLESAACSLYHVGERAAKITPTPPWLLTLSALTPTPAPTHFARQTLMFANSESTMKHLGMGYFRKQDQIWSIDAISWSKFVRLFMTTFMTRLVVERVKPWPGWSYLYIRIVYFWKKINLILFIREGFKLKKVKIDGIFHLGGGVQAIPSSFYFFSVWLLNHPKLH